MMPSILIILAVLCHSNSPTADAGRSEFMYDAQPLALITPLLSGMLLIPLHYGRILFLDETCEARPIPWQWDASRCCSAPSANADSAAVGVSSGGDYIILFTPDDLLEAYGPYSEAGRPVFDDAGNLWFTADGFLHRNGISTGIELERHTISIDGSGLWIVYCDESDRICIFRTDSHEKTVLSSDYRFYDPAFVSFEEILTIISPSLEGKILRISPLDGECTVLAEGSHPFWWEERESMLYAVTSDDGHQITTSEIWLVSSSGEKQQLSATPDIHEICPAVINSSVYAIEAVKGNLIEVIAR